MAFVTVYPLRICVQNLAGTILILEGDSVWAYCFMVGCFESMDFCVSHTCFISIGHLLFHYNKADVIVSYEEGDDSKEQQANQFARDFFVDTIKYGEFCKNAKYTADEIRKFAKAQNILPEFVVAMLKHDKKIEYNQFNHI